MRRILTLQSAVSNPLPKRVSAVFGLAALLFMGGWSKAASPDFVTTIPRGGKAGAEVSIQITGNRLSDAEEILFHGPGLAAKELKVVDDKKVEAVIVVAPDCRVGVHHFRIRCRSGISFARTFWVSQFPNHDEVEPNDDFAAPQKIPMNVTVEGEAKIEETDYYQVSAKKGDRLSVEIEALRINNGVGNDIAIDPYVAIFDKERNEIVSADGSALLKQESLVSIEVPEDGDYIVEVRDSAYRGRGRYRVHIGNFPRPTAIFPAGGKAGSEVEFTLLGDVKGPYKFKTKLPESADNDEFGILAPNGGMVPPSPNRVRISAVDNLFEKEPNNAHTEATEAGAFPFALNGIIEKEGDIDFFKFTAKKDQAFQIRVFANALGSPLDPTIVVYNSKMGGVGSNDDADGTKDSRFDFKAPEDGDYYIRITDMLSRGGPDYVYRIESVSPPPSIEVTMPEMLRNTHQHLKQFNIPQGSYYTMVVSTTRKGVAGDLKFEMPALPPGVTMEAGIVPKTIGQFPILLKAAPDAPVGGGLYDLLVKTVEGDKPHVGKFVQSLDFVRGPQNGDRIYYGGTIDKLPVAVTEPLPFTVTIDQPKVPIVRNGSLRLKVRVHRKEGFDKKVTVRFPWIPPGITAPATVIFDEKANEVLYELNANANAELNTWNLSVLAETDEGKGVAHAASPFIKLAVEEPFLNIKFSMATAKQGETTEMVAEIEHLRDLPGDADIQLFGLPANSTAEVQKLKPAVESLAFSIVTTDKTPVGQHKGVFCTAIVVKDGEPIVHRLAMGSVLRVDPKPKEAPAQPAVAAAPAPEKKEKPLSRLEQLRLEAQKEAAAP